MSGTEDGLKASQSRLWKLIEERCKPGADTAALDKRIWDLFGEHWAIMFTDLSGFSRRVSEFGIVHFLQVIYEQRKLLLPIVEAHDGLLLKEEGDSFMIMFRTADRAVDCGIAMQKACGNVNERRKPEEQILLCLGIGYGRILRIGDSDVWGREVNGASKLGEDTAKPYEILVTDAAREALTAQAGYTFEDIGAGSFGGASNYRLIYK
ncbi:MAG TPA: adenylate/guanylate cyclase domain-containing protein [Polyangiaceae bacterium]|nr:adenylate/guanylate cyclase domain-containing protein [Polyangiaceae bacterium]